MGFFTMVRREKYEGEIECSQTDLGAYGIGEVANCRLRIGFT